VQAGVVLRWLQACDNFEAEHSGQVRHFGGKAGGGFEKLNWSLIKSESKVALLECPFLVAFRNFAPDSECNNSCSCSYT
jgi:hypothetical protein